MVMLGWCLVHFRRFHLSSSRGTPSQTVRAGRRIIPFSTEIHWRYQNYRHDVRRDVGEKYRTISGTLMEIVNCQMCGLVSQDSPSEKTTGWIYKIQEGDWQENKRHQGPTNFGQKCGNRCLMHQHEKRNKSGLLTMPEDYVVFISLILKTSNSTLLWKMLVERWKFRCQQQCLVKLLCAEVAGKTRRTSGEHKTNYACIVGADESMRIRLEGAPRRYHEDHIAGKGMNSWSHYNLVHKFIPMSEAMKIPDAKAAVNKQWENSIKYQHGSTRKSETKMRWSLKQGMRSKPYTLRR